MHDHARAAGRDPAGLPLEGRIRLAGQNPEGWLKQVHAWKALGATSVIAEPRNAGLRFADGTWTRWADSRRAEGGDMSEPLTLRIFSDYV